MTNPFEKFIELANDKTKWDELFPGKTETERLSLAEALAKRLELRSTEDKREAAKLACEAAKLFITISVAVTGALFVFAQALVARGVFAQVLPLAAITFVLLVVSMALGFFAIAKAYKGAEGRTGSGKNAKIDQTKEPWPVRATSPFLGFQGLTGLAAIGVFATLIISTPTTAQTDPSVRFSVTIPDADNSSTHAGPLTIGGDWTTLTLRTSTGEVVTLPAQQVADPGLRIVCD